MFVAKLEEKIELLGKEIALLDLIIGVVLTVVGLIWLIGLIIFLVKKRRKTESYVKKRKVHTKPEKTKRWSEVRVDEDDWGSEVETEVSN